MGKRKSAKKPGAGRVKPKPLDKVFKCLFCQHVGTVMCKLDRPGRVGRLDCKDCLQSFQASITALDEPVDLYSMWIDACDAVNVQAPPATRQPRQQARRAAQDDDDDDDDDDLPTVARAKSGSSRKDLADIGDVNNDDDDDEGDDLPDVGRKAANPASSQRAALSSLASGKSGSTSKSAMVVDDDEDDD
ncbi:hypothetical protein EMMF5_001227 [Cystobasidiomycetes sp. EMM_F5]